jgi:hypothetical protein
MKRQSYKSLQGYNVKTVAFYNVVMLLTLLTFLARNDNCSGGL